MKRVSRNAQRIICSGILDSSHFHASPEGLRGFVIPCVDDACPHMLPCATVSIRSTVSRVGVFAYSWERSPLIWKNVSRPLRLACFLGSDQPMLVAFRIFTARSFSDLDNTLVSVEFPRPGSSKEKLEDARQSGIHFSSYLPRSTLREPVPPYISATDCPRRIFNQ